MQCRKLSKAASLRQMPTFPVILREAKRSRRISLAGPLLEILRLRFAPRGMT